MSETSAPTPTNSKPTASGILIEGAIWKKGWVGWSQRFGRVEDQKILLWKDKSRTSFSGCIDMQQATKIENSVPEAKVHRAHCFMIKILMGKNEITFYFASDSDEEKGKWLKAIHQAFELGRVAPATPPGSPGPSAATCAAPILSTPSPSVTPSWKAKILSKFASTALGRTAIASFISEDGVAVITLITESLKKMACRLSPHEANADEFQSIIYTVGVDIIYLINDKLIPKDSLLLLRDPVFALWSHVLDMLEISFVFDETLLAETVDLLWDSVAVNILPALPDHKRQQLEKVYRIFANKQHLLEWYTEAKYEKERQAFKATLRHVWNGTFRLEKKGGEFK